MSQRPAGEYGLWIGAYGDTGPPLDAATVLGIFDAAASLFDLRLNRILGQGVDLENRRVAEPRQWLEEELALQAQNAASSQDGIGTPLVICRPAKDYLLWYLEAICETVYGSAHRFEDGVLGNRLAPDPCLFFGIDFGLALTPDSVRLFADQVARLLMRNSRIWYGFINPAPRYHIPHPSTYSGYLMNTLSWEQLVENDFWHYHQRGTRDRVRGLFWGNIFGPDFARRILDAGLEERMQWLREDHPWYPPDPLRDESGSMTFFLDDDPVAFAKTRDLRGGYELGMHCDAASVRGGGLLRSVLSRTGLF